MMKVNSNSNHANSECIVCPHFVGVREGYIFTTNIDPQTGYYITGYYPDPRASSTSTNKDCIIPSRGEYITCLAFIVYFHFTQYNTLLYFPITNFPITNYAIANYTTVYHGLLYF